MSVHKKENTTSALARSVSLNEIGENVDSWSLPSEVGFATCVRALRQNWRQGTVACKSRGDLVSRSNKKPWKQKGTGRARAGSARSPLWRGGGVVHGPQPRDRQLKVSKSLRRGVMRALISQFASDGRIFSLDWMFSADRPKTSLAYNALKDAGIAGNNLVLFLPVNDVITAASFANIPNVQLLSFDEPNIYHLANVSQWVFLKKDFNLFKQMVSKWS